MSLLATEQSRLSVAKMLKMAVSLERIQNRQIPLSFRREASVELLLFWLYQGSVSAPSRPTQGRAFGLRKFRRHQIASSRDLTLTFSARGRPLTGEAWTGCRERPEQ
jgi:hypothetical protein